MSDFALDKNFKGLNDVKLLSSRVERTFDQLVDLFNQNNDNVSTQLTTLATATALIPGIQADIKTIAASISTLSTLVNVPIPATSTSAGILGDFAIDATNGIYYFCYGTNLWLQITAGFTF